MKYKKSKKLSILLTLSSIALLSIIACEDADDLADGSDTSETLAIYDDVLENLSENVITPSITQYQTSITSLSEAVDEFSQTTTQVNLDAVKTAYKTAYLDFQKIAIHNFGTIAELKLSETNNFYPVDTTDAKEFIEAEDYDFSDILGSDSHKKANGFPVIDYLLHNDDVPLTLFENDDKAITFLDTLVGYMLATATEINTSWATEKENYVANTGIQSGSSLSTHINASLAWFEDAIRDDKVGNIIGKNSPNEEFDAIENALEAYFEAEANSNEDFSIELLESAIDAFEKFYLGNDDDGTEGKGFDDVLEELGKTSIDTEIKAQFTSIKNTIDTRGQISGDDALHAAIQEIITIWKSDFFNALNITDGDGISDGD